MRSQPENCPGRECTDAEEFAWGKILTNSGR